MSRRSLFGAACVVVAIISFCFFIGSLSSPSTPVPVPVGADGEAVAGIQIPWGLILSTCLGSGSLVTAIGAFLTKAVPSIGHGLGSSTTPGGSVTINPGGKQGEDVIELVEATLFFVNHRQDPAAIRRFAMAVLTELGDLFSSQPTVQRAISGLTTAIMSVFFPSPAAPPAVPSVIIPEIK